MSRLIISAIIALLAIAAASDVSAAGWTGCYAGINAGHAWARTTLVETSVNGVPNSFDRGTQHDKGGAIGGQVGCDWRLDGNWVAGVRGMWDGSHITGSVLVPPGDYVAGTDHVKIKSFATLIARLGYVLAPNVQVYGLGGVALVKDHYFGTVPPDSTVFSGDQHRLGYDVGVGLSWTFRPNWDVWGEYDHIGLGTKNLTFYGEGANAGTTLGIDSTQHINMVLVGVNYHF